MLLHILGAVQKRSDASVQMQGVQKAGRSIFQTVFLQLIP
jgi:hypothetical protein